MNRKRNGSLFVDVAAEASFDTVEGNVLRDLVAILPYFADDTVEALRVPAKLTDVRVT